MRVAEGESRLRRVERDIVAVVLVCCLGLCCCCVDLLVEIGSSKTNVGAMVSEWEDV